MKKISCLILLSLSFFLFNKVGYTQTLLGTYFDPSVDSFYIVTIDLDNCTACKILGFEEFTPAADMWDFTVLEDGRLLTAGNELAIYDPPYNSPILYGLPPPGGSIRGIHLFSGTVYMLTFFGLFTFDPATDQIDFIGSWPPALVLGGFNYELFDYSGDLYAMEMGVNGGTEIWLIDTADPPNSSLVNILIDRSSGVTTLNGDVITTDQTWVQIYDFDTNTNTDICFGPDMGIPAFTLNNLSYLPASIPPLPCLCDTNAGSMAGGTENICLPDGATAPFNNDESLENDDLLQYILFTDLNDILGSILVTSNTPTFEFNAATMQAGVTYYLATIAGDDLNGNVDLDDDCLSISNAAEVVWQIPPTVELSLANPDVCQGECVDIDLTFTGNPPFELAYDAPGNPGQTANFNNLNDLLEICIPVGAAIGSFDVELLSLSDAFCTCE
ncbi:MAG: hypothetical protein AAFZ15_00095 [Bacteroidota bacterium]